MLRETFARVAERRTPELLTILGEPGIGKSRLVAELAAARVRLTGRCRAYGEGITMWPLREVVAQVRGERTRRRARRRAGDPGGRRAARGRRGRAAEDGEPGEDTDWALQQLVGGLARQAPLALVIDDAHWAEPALLDLLLDLVARLRDAPVLVVWVARPDLLERAGGRLERGDRDHAAAAVARGQRRRCSPRSAAAACPPRSSGGSRPRRAATRCSSSSSSPTSASGGRRTELPPALHALLSARLDRLDAAERAALALGAVAGDTFTAASVHALAAGLAPPRSSAPASG